MNTTTYNDRYFEFVRTLLMRLNNGKDNAVFSPFSLLMLLTIAADATTGKTRDEIVKVLCGELNYDEVKKIISDIQEQLIKDDSLHSANAVILKEELKDSVVDGYEDKLIQQFGGKMFAEKDMVSAVNEWVNEHTNGLIPQAADESMKDMLVALINAIAFEAEWETEYGGFDIVNDDFTNMDGSISRVKMLESQESTYIENNVFEGFAKPYKETGYSYIALLPKIKGKINDEQIKGIDPSSFRVNPNAVVSVTMPEFTCTFEQNMAPILNELGIKILFTEKADFSPLSKSWLKAESIIHKTKIDVNRKGTKAAAVSFMAVCAGALPDFEIEIKEIKLNRPFIYAIVHNDTGLPVFVGTINHLDALTGDDLMTRDEMWNLFDEIIKSWPGVDWDLVEVDYKANSPERKFYRKAWEALANHDGKTLREVKDEVADYLKKHKGTLAN